MQLKGSDNAKKNGLKNVTLKLIKLRKKQRSRTVAGTAFLAKAAPAQNQVITVVVAANIVHHESAAAVTGALRVRRFWNETLSRDSAATIRIIALSTNLACDK